MSVRTVLLADRVVTLDDRRRVFAPGGVAVVDGQIEAVGPPEQVLAGAVDPSDELLAGNVPANVPSESAGGNVPGNVSRNVSSGSSGAQVVRLPGRVLLPGLVNVHTHTPMWLFRGLTEDPPRDQWLSLCMRPFEQRASLQDLVHAAAAGALELLLNGVTTTADRYGHMDAVAPTIDATGLRAVVAQSLYDDGAAEAFARTEDLLERYGADPERSRVTVAIGPHATDTCGPDVLRRVRQLAERHGARVVIHLAQSPSEVATVQRREHLGCAAYLDRLGLLGPDVLVAHATYLSDDEAELVGRRRTAVAHCPSSNAKLEGRVAPVARMQSAGATLGLGTDAAPCNNGMDLFEEMKIAGLLNKVAADDPAAMTADAVLRMATRDGARALGLDGLVGSIEVGKLADVIAVRTDRARLQPWHDDAANLVYVVRGSDVSDVWIGGEHLVRNGHATHLDEEQILRRATEAAMHVRNVTNVRHAYA